MIISYNKINVFSLGGRYVNDSLPINYVLSMISYFVYSL